MKVFRVVTQRDGNTIKAPGISETQLKQVDRRYAAETFKQVWDEIEPIRSDPEEELIAIIEEHPAIQIVTANVEHNRRELASVLVDGPVGPHGSGDD